MDKRAHLITAFEHAEELLQRQAMESLLGFTLYTMPGYRVNWHHRALCQKLDDFVHKKIKRLMVFMPPRHGKSELGSRRTPAFIFGHYPQRRIIGTSYSDDLAAKMNRDIKRIMAEDPYRRLFPDSFLNNQKGAANKGNWINNSSEFEIVEKGGGYRSAGVGVGITGMGCDYLIIDDPFKDSKQADSPTYREAVWDWYNTTSKTRLQAGGSILIILTRWHEDDLAGRLLEQQKSNPKADKWEVVQFEAVKDTTANPEDPRDFGEALWPSEFNEAFMEGVQAGMPARFWNALYQQRPSAMQGNIIDRSKVNFYGGPTGAPLPEKFRATCHSWDFTFKESKDSDYVVGTVWGADKSDFYLLDRVRDRMGFTKSLQAAKDLARRWPNYSAILVEEKANGAAIIDVLKRELSRIVPIIPKESKVARFEAVSPLFDAGNIWLPHPSIAPWVDEFLDELCTFPNGATDDQVDSASQALNWLDGKTRSSIFKLAQL